MGKVPGVNRPRKPPMEKRRDKLVSTRLNRAELRQFRAAERYVRALCGKVSRAEVLRYLVRNWYAS